MDDIIRRLSLPQNTDENCSVEMAKLCDDALKEIIRLRHFEKYYDARMMYQTEFEAKWGREEGGSNV